MKMPLQFNEWQDRYCSLGLIRILILKLSSEVKIHTQIKKRVSKARRYVTCGQYQVNEAFTNLNDNVNQFNFCTAKIWKGIHLRINNKKSID